MTYLRAPLSCSTAQRFELVHSFHLFPLLPYSVLLLKRSRNFPRNSALKSKFVFVWAGGGQVQEQSWCFCVQYHSILYVWSAFTLHIMHCPHLPTDTHWYFTWFEVSTRTDLSTSETQSLCSASLQRIWRFCKAYETASVLQIQVWKRKKEVAFPFWGRGNCG